MPDKRHIFTEKQREILTHLLENVKKSDGARKNYTDVCEAYNCMNIGPKRTPAQIRNFVTNTKRMAKLGKLGKKRSYQGQVVADSIICNNIRSVIPPTPSPRFSLNGGLLSTSDTSEVVDINERNFFEMAEDDQHEWDFADALEANGDQYANSPHQGSTSNWMSSMESNENSNTYVLVDKDLHMNKSPALKKNEQSRDLVNILAQQSSEHHRLKIQILKDKFKKATDLHQKKVEMLEKEHEMKRREHEMKIKILLQKYNKAKNDM